MNLVSGLGRTHPLLERRRKQAGFRDPDRTLDNFDFTFKTSARNGQI